MKQALKAEVNKFSKGIITEASDLAFPADASLDEQNFVLTTKGIRKRRKGLQNEKDGSPSLYLPLGSKVGAVFYWDSPNGDSANPFTVTNVGKEIFFYKTNITPLTLFATIDLTPHTTDVLALRPDFSSVDGRLIVVTGSKNICVVSFDGTTFTVATGRLIVRDHWGVEEVTGLETDPSVRPTTLSDVHYYNLQNQSWGLPRRGDGALVEDPVDIYETEYPGVYPSNTESVWTAMEHAPVAPPNKPYERIYPSLFKEGYNGGVAAAKGYYLIDALERGDARVEAFEANQAKYPELNLKTSITLPADISSKGAAQVTTYSGRLFYSGFSGDHSGTDIRSPSLNNYLLFSQVIKNLPDTFKCYQEGDPTSRENADVVDTDGGFIKVSEAVRIIATAVFRESLMVFCDNGVWRLSGGGDYGFTAANYKLEKVSDKRCISLESIVTVGSDVMFWAEDGIYIITKNQFGDVVVNSLTLTTIHSFYLNIPLPDKSGVSGSYSEEDKTVRWLYIEDGVSKELCFSVPFAAFTRNRFYNGPGLVVQKVFIKTIGAAPTYIVTSVASIEGVLFTRYSFAELTNEDYKDYDVDAHAFLQTGDQTANDTSSEKQIPYLIMHFTRTEDAIDGDGVPLKQSGCLAMCRWGWSVSDVSKKWSRQFQAYRERKPLFSDDDYVNGFKVVTSKSKIRGRGKAFSLYFETEAGKDCQLLGWNLTLNGNQFT